MIYAKIMRDAVGDGGDTLSWTNEVYWVFGGARMPSPGARLPRSLSGFSCVVWVSCRVPSAFLHSLSICSLGYHRLSGFLLPIILVCRLLSDLSFAIWYFTCSLMCRPSRSPVYSGLINCLIFVSVFWDIIQLDHFQTDCLKSSLPFQWFPGCFS